MPPSKPGPNCEKRIAEKKAPTVTTLIWTTIFPSALIALPALARANDLVSFHLEGAERPILFCRYRARAVVYIG